MEVGFIQFEGRMLKRLSDSLFISFIVFFAVCSIVQAQQADYRLNVSRTFGYGNGSQIRGTFKLSVVGPENIHTVRYVIDDQLIAEVTSAPYTYTFQTTQYPNGWHDLSAIIETNDGTKVTTPARRLNFVSAEEESSGLAGIIIPIVGGIVIVMAGVVAFQTIILRKKPLTTLPLGASRNYGIRGGTICPKCRRPYGIHWWALKVGLRNRFDRCEFCGKWSIIYPLSRIELESAEAAELEQIQAESQIPAKTEQDRLKEMLDNSRYTDQ
jgi:hypothetical protein